MMILPTPKRKISLASMVLGTLLMTSFSAGNANALPTLPKCAECNRITCNNSKIFNHCVEKCDYSLIKNCVSANCSQLKPDQKAHLKSVLEEKISANERKKMAEALKPTPQSDAALGTGEGAAAMAGSSSKGRVKVIKREADLVTEINMLKVAMEHCGLSSTSNAPSTPDTNTSPTPSPEHEKPTEPTSQDTPPPLPPRPHRETPSQQGSEGAHTQLSLLPPKVQESQNPEETNPLHAQITEGKTKLKPVPSREGEGVGHTPSGEQKPEETSSLQNTTNQRGILRQNKKGEDTPTNKRVRFSPSLSGDSTSPEDSASKTHPSQAQSLLQVAKTSQEQLNPVVKTVTPSVEEATPPQGDSGIPTPPPSANAAQSSGTHSGTPPHGNPPPPVPRDHPLPPPPMGNVASSQGATAPKVAAHHGQSGRDDLSAAIKNNPKQNLRKVDPNAPKPEPKPEGIQAALEEALAARRERVKPEESEEQKLTPEEQAAKDKEWE